MCDLAEYGQLSRNGVQCTTPSHRQRPLPGLPDLRSLSIAYSGPCGNIRLSNAHQKGIYNLFTGYSTQSRVPRGDDLLSQIREDLEPQELVDPMITMNYEIYKNMVLSK